MNFWRLFKLRKKSVWKGGKKAFVGILAIGLPVLLFMLVPLTAKASGLVEFTQNTQYLYSTYDLGNYDLDFYVDSSWSWLPWNWMDAIGRQVMYGIYCLTNMVWMLSRLLSSATGSVVSEAYTFDLINEAADSIGTNMQHLAGVSTSGISSDGFYFGFLPWVLLILGIYVVYKGMFKREMSVALGAVLKTVLIFLFTGALIAYAPECIRNVNDFSADISHAALDLGTGVVMPGSNQGEGDSVDLIRDNLFSIQVYQPWLLMQWGTTDVDAIGSDRVSALLSASPDGNYGTDRDTIVKGEVETYGNMRMSVLKVTARFGEVLFIFLINLVISIFVIFLCGLMVFTQILFVIYTLFLVISFVLAMFPACEGMLKRSLVKVFNIIMLRAGYTLLITVAFTVSTMIYSISQGHSFAVIGFLQIVTFVGVFFAKNEILGMISLPEDTGTRRAGSLLGGALIYRGLRRSQRQRALPVRSGEAAARITKAPRKWVNKKLDQAKEYQHEAVDEAKMQLKFAKRKAEGAVDYQLHGLKGTDKETVAKNQKAAEMEKRRRERDYTLADRMPEEKASDFHTGREKGVSSARVYDKYLERFKPQKQYKLSRNTPQIQNMDFTSASWKEAQGMHVRPSLWKQPPEREKVEKKYRRRHYDNKSADGISWDALGVDLRDDQKGGLGGTEKRVKEHMPGRTPDWNAGRNVEQKHSDRSIGRNVEQRHPDRSVGGNVEQRHPDRSVGENVEQVHLDRSVGGNVERVHPGRSVGENVEQVHPDRSAGGEGEYVKRSEERKEQIVASVKAEPVRRETRNYKTSVEQKKAENAEKKRKR